MLLLSVYTVSVEETGSNKGVSGVFILSHMSSLSASSFPSFDVKEPLTFCVAYTQYLHG